MLVCSYTHIKCTFHVLYVFSVFGTSCLEQVRLYHYLASKGLTITLTTKLNLVVSYKKEIQIIEAVMLQ